MILYFVLINICEMQWLEFGLILGHLVKILATFVNCQLTILL